MAAEQLILKHKRSKEHRARTVTLPFIMARYVRLYQSKYSHIVLDKILFIILGE